MKYQHNIFISYTGLAFIFYFFSNPLQSSGFSSYNFFPLMSLYRILLLSFCTPEGGGCAHKEYLKNGLLTSHTFCSPMDDFYYNVYNLRAFE
jgi:hypothetical protein